ncbi:MAG: hypothetical protein BWY87_00264 [Deltaproteobacteria bacterium ADurb.Bin510]|nr:MAG: hypothetical protein BWY87_00264 [Deltaproteobacteria bacterium ADurb.Bin510]
MVDAGRVGNDQGGAVVGLGLGQGLHELALVGAERHLGHVHVAVANGHQAQILLADLLAAGGELGHGRGRGRLGRLAAGVGVDLGVHDQDVDVLAAGQHVVDAAVADVVGPAVAAEGPDRLLGEVVLELEDGLGRVTAVGSQRCDQLLAGGLAGLAVVHGLEPGLHGSLAGGRRAVQIGLDHVGQGLALLADGQGHAVAEFGVVLEERAGPGWTLALGVDAVGRGRSRAAVDRRAAGGVGDQHAVAVELGDGLDVGRFAAAGAGARELEERLEELAALDALGVEVPALVADVLDHPVPLAGLGLLRVEALHDQRLFLGRADLHAVAAAGTVIRADLDAEAQGFTLDALGLDEGDVGRSLGLLGLVYQEGPDDGVRADDGALVALDAVVMQPLGYLDGDAALFVGGGAVGEGAVLAALEGRDRQLVALLGDDRLDDLGDELGHVGADGLGVDRQVLPGRVDVHLHQAVLAGIDRGVVHVDDVVALLAVGLLDGVLHVIDRLAVVDDLAQVEEGRLHDRVGAVAQADLGTDLGGVDDVELDVVLGHVTLHAVRQAAGGFLGAPDAVEQEGATLLEAREHVVLVDVGRHRAGHEVGLLDQVGRTDRRLAESQVRNRQAARLLGVIGEVALGVHVGVVADDFDRVLVGAHGAIRAQTVELALDRTLSRAFDLGQQRQRGVGDVVDDADGEAILGVHLLEVVEHADDLGRGGVLGAQTVAAAHDDGGIRPAVEGALDVQIERLAAGAGLLGAVEHCDLLDALGHGLEEVVQAEGPVEVDAHDADLFALLGQVVDGFLDGFGDRAHGHDHALGIRSAVVVEGVVLAAGDGFDLLHVVFDHVGNGVVERVGRFPGLEVDVGVLGQTAGDRMLGVERAGAEALQGLLVDQLGQFLVGNGLDLLDFVRASETVEEVQEGQPAFKCNQVRDAGDVHDLLDAAAGQHAETGLAGRVDVGVVAEDRERVGRQRAGADMQHAGQQFARDLVHVGNHQQQALRAGEAGSQGAGLE